MNEKRIEALEALYRGVERWNNARNQFKVILFSPNDTSRDQIRDNQVEYLSAMKDLSRLYGEVPL